MYSTLIELFENKKATFFIILLSTSFVLYQKRLQITTIMESLSQVSDNLTKSFRNKMLGRWAPRTGAQEQEILKRGGYIGGLVNDGNTCFMNSVLQSLASSNELLKFIDQRIINKVKMGRSEIGDESVCIKNQKANDKKKYGKCKNQLNELNNEKEDDFKEPDILFSRTLKELLDNLNAKHYRERPYFKTNKLLKTMSKAPNKNIILGYDQEDAQEFFQAILSELEKNVHSIYGKANNDQNPVAEDKLPQDSVIGQAHLGKVGTIFMPTEQIDPNFILNESRKHYTPFELVTPLDGITAERIGCLQCGENGGIRYSLFSGLSLNLPSENIGSPIKLSQLLYDWSKPEIIEGVECNRCALNAVYQHLTEQLKQYKSQDSIPEKLVDLVNDRLDRLRTILSKPVIDDDDYKKLHTDNMVRKCSKSKQILIPRPPSLLSIHINRSVFDTNTYMIKKNNSQVIFKTRLNLSPWCCDIDQINLDARLPMSKKQQELNQESSDDDKIIGEEYYSKLHRRFQREFEDSDEEDYMEEEEVYCTGLNRDVSNYDPLNLDGLSSKEEMGNLESDDLPHTKVDSLGNNINENVDCSEEEYSESDYENGKGESSVSLPIPIEDSYVSNVPIGPLTYVLRAIIVHYGTHNYGHYITFRKYRGSWWRISDEAVYIVDEAEVLSTPGVFMLFYEYDFDEATGMMKEDLEFQQDSSSEVEITCGDNDLSDDGLESN